MKRAIFLAMAALLAMLILVPMAVAQDTTMMNTVGSPPPTGGPTPTTGGPAILLPAAALLLGSGILTYAILRRR
jgi:UDP-N-acetylmuramyl pentapeptide phosphotransferase/UDP-N-acetylglucosamine-1-phosphate transferase